MRLLTLGGLYVEQLSFGRVKPLLLLSYLALEGPQERRYLAELFWPGASDPMNSLSAALTKLRKAAGGLVEADEQRAWTSLETDVSEVLNAVESGNLKTALELYGGAFVQGLSLSLGEELEEWLYSTRESVAAKLRRGLLKSAENEAASGRFPWAARRAEAAYDLDGSSPCEPEELSRFYLLLKAGDSVLANRVQDEAASFGVELNTSADAARTRLQRVLLGRRRETSRLKQLLPGEWAWVQGGAGMGKTALLKSLSGTFLYGRSGLPYATLAPLAGSALESEDAVLQKLLRLNGTWLLDNWERIDKESRSVLLRLHEMRSAVRVIITSREAPPFAVDAHLDLGAIQKEHLDDEAWQATHGLPALVGAQLRGEPLDMALATRLTLLPAAACHIYLALALLDKPDLALVRRALGLGADVTAHALEDLLAAGLVEPSGQVRVRRAAQAHLEAHPTLLGPLSIKLARELTELDAFPLYSRARLLWEEDDLPRIRKAYLAWANELLRRGFPQKASETLEDAPPSEDVTFLQARALERAGRYQEAFECAKPLTDNPDLLALKSVLYYRLGKPDEAKAAAEAALTGGSMEARAEGMNTLGQQARYRGEYREAAKYYKRAAALWQAQGRRARWADALNNLGIAQYWLEEDSERTYQEALEAAGGNLVLRARVFINLGIEYERKTEMDKAAQTYHQAITLAEEARADEVLTRAWNNIGWVYHQCNDKVKAENAYRKCLEIAQHAGEHEMLGTVLGNLAELTEDVETWKEALQILEAAGQQAAIDEMWEGLPQNHSFRERSGNSA